MAFLVAVPFVVAAEIVLLAAVFGVIGLGWITKGGSSHAKLVISRFFIGVSFYIFTIYLRVGNVVDDFRRTSYDIRR